MVKGGVPQSKDWGAKSKPQTAAQVQWAAAAGQIVAVPSDKGSECALLARFGRPSGGAALQAVDVQQVCGGGASGEKGVVLCVAHVCDISIGLGIFVALVCSPGEDTCSYSLYRINDKPSTKSAAPLVTFTVSGSGPGNLFEQGYSSSWVTDGPVVCVPKENGLAVAQLAHRGGNMGFCWSVHVVRVTGSPCRLLTVGCFQSDISLPFALLTTKQNDTWTWVTAPLSNPNPQHASPPFLPHSVANVTICALILPRSAHAFALGTHSSEIVLVNQGGMIALTICLSIAPRFLCLADTCSSIGPVLAVRSLDSPPALQLVPLRSRTPFSCKTASLASLASEVFPVALSGPAHDAIVVPCQADTPSESFEGCVCISLKEVLLTDEGQAKEASGLVKVAKALELKSLGCIQELQKLQEQLSQKRHLREHTHSLLLRAVLPKISHTHSPGSSTLNQKAPLMIQLGGHAAPPSPARELLNVPMVYNVQHHYNGGRLYVSATANNPYQRPLKNVALCLVANGMQCESRGGRPSAIPSEESLDISGCARVIEGDGHLARGGWWAFECLLRWELDGEVRVPQGGRSSCCKFLMSSRRISRFEGRECMYTRRQALSVIAEYLITQENTTWGARVLVSPGERLRGGSGAQNAELGVSCECDVLMRASQGRSDGTLDGAPKVVAELLGAKESGIGVWVREKEPWLHISSAGGEREVRVCVKAVDEASLSLAIDAVIEGIAHRPVDARVVKGEIMVDAVLESTSRGVDVRAVKGGVKRDADLVWNALDALIQELDYGVDVCSGAGESHISPKWLRLQAETDRMISVLLQG